MIVVRIVGGLGNQMFQYALGRNLSIRTGQSLRLDIHTPNANHLGAFGLQEFRIVGSFVGVAENRLIWRPLARASATFHRERFLLVQREKTLAFHPGVLGIRGSAYLCGYWQSEKYFSEIGPILRSDFTPKADVDDFDERLLAQMSSEQSVAVHIRRGDYIGDPRVTATHGICGTDYYESARQLMTERLGNPCFYIFSDDRDWARITLRGWSSTRVVDHHPITARMEDFRLMRGCRHFIIANSSFSWWAAWLAETADQVVVAPRRWFADPTLISVDIVPQRWTRL
jgi:Glycosyl transferase family 11